MSNNTPQIRFKGFTDAWEQRKISTFSEETYGGGTPKTSEGSFWNGELPWIQSSDLTEHEIFTVTSKKKITQAGLKSSAAKLIPANSIAVVTRVGVGKLAFMPSAYTTSQDFLSLSKLNLDERFGTYSLYKKLQKESKFTQGTSIKGITRNELLNKIILAPASESEQAAIGNFFHMLDQAITLQQRKLEALQKLKQGYLQQMFPQEGEAAPRVRFAGFDEPWEVRKLSEFLTESRILGTTGLEAKKLTVKLWGKGIVSKDSIFEGSANTSYYMRRAGQIMYGKLDFLNAAFGIVPNDLDGYESTLDAPSFDVSLDANAKFLLEVFLQRNFYEFLGNMANGSRRAKRINQRDFLAMSISVPSLSEQTAISNFLHALDNQIACQADRMKCLQVLKRGYLQEMLA